jgi:hypothetical protein
VRVKNCLLLNPAFKRVQPSLRKENDFIRRGADKSLAFLISCFPICTATKGFFLDGLKKLEQRSRVWELSGEYVE